MEGQGKCAEQHITKLERAEGIEPFSAQRGRLAANLLLARYAWVFPHLSAEDHSSAGTLMHQSRRSSLAPSTCIVREWMRGLPVFFRTPYYRLAVSRLSR